MGYTTEFAFQFQRFLKACLKGLDVLLKKQDVQRNIEHHQIYKKLSLKPKEDYSVILPLW